MRKNAVELMNQTPLLDALKVYNFKVMNSMSITNFLNLMNVSWQTITILI